MDTKRSTKKYVIIAVSVILAAIIILTAVLVGIYLFYNAQKDILQFTLDVNENSKQEVTSDPNNNVVQYHVQNPNYDLWVINDFNRDIQTLKVTEEATTVCYLTPLNRTVSLSPSDITNGQSGNGENPESKNATERGSNTAKYRVSNTPISDTSFLSKTASDACKGISTYWVYPYCERSSVNEPIRKRRQSSATGASGVTGASGATVSSGGDGGDVYLFCCNHIVYILIFYCQADCTIILVVT